MKLDSNTVTLVTGGASGLGLATVHNFLAKGCKVVIGDFNEAAGKKLLEELNNRNLRFFKTDVSNEENVIALIKYTVAEFGAIHVVVNSAGVATAGLTATTKGVVSSDELQRVFKINVLGTVNVSKHAAFQMITQEAQGEFKQRGVIVLVASLAGIEGQRGQLIYAATKGAVIGMTLPMARDLGRYGIRVVTLAPGVLLYNEQIFETPMGHGIQPKVAEALKKSSALDRFGTPAEFADAVTGLCMNTYISGEVIRLDGAQRMPHL